MGPAAAPLARLKRERSEEIIIATKAGRRLEPHIASGYNRQNLSDFIDRSLRNLETDALDLLQLHCPPTEAYDNPQLFAALDDFVKQGKIRYYGLSNRFIILLQQFGKGWNGAFGSWSDFSVKLSLSSSISRC